jgi:hypothetical protein
MTAYPRPKMPTSTDYDKTDDSDYFAKKLKQIHTFTDEDLTRWWFDDFLGNCNGEMDVAKRDAKSQSEQIAFHQDLLTKCEEIESEGIFGVCPELKLMIDRIIEEVGEHQNITISYGNELINSRELLANYDDLQKKKENHQRRRDFAKLMKECDFICVRFIMEIKHKQPQKAQYLLNELQVKFGDIMEMVEKIIEDDPNSAFTNHSPRQEEDGSMSAEVEADEQSGQGGLVLIAKLEKVKYNHLSFMLQVLINEGWRIDDDFELS